MTLKPGSLDRREFLALTGGVLAATQVPLSAQGAPPAAPPPAAPPPIVRPDPMALRTNIAVAMRQPKTPFSMPGAFPGVVAEVHQPGCVKDLQPLPGRARPMLEAGLKALTGEADARAAWRRFVSPGERIGIKFNPVGHRICGTTHEVIRAVVDGLEAAGIPRKDMLVWHRFDDEHARTYTPEEAHPGVEAYLLNWFIPKDGKNTPGGIERWDEGVYYEADFSLPDAQNYLEEMFHGGPRSLFPRILTKGGKDGGVDKVINIPVLKHHGSGFLTMALKNLAYGATTNCPRGHYFLDRYIPEVCAFPPLRDKVVLHIADAYRVQYDKGPVPNAPFVVPHERLYLATDPVAMDTVGFETLLQLQLQKGSLKPERVEALRRRIYLLAYAENLGLGVHKGRPIDHRRVRLA